MRNYNFKGFAMRLKVSSKVILFLLTTIILYLSETAFADNSDNLTNQEKHEALFNHDYLHDIEIIMSQQEWDGLIQDMKDYAEKFYGSLQTGNYRKAKFIYRGPAGDTVIEDVGFRTKGRFTRVIPQDDEGIFHRAHFKLKFDKTFDLEEGTDAYDQRRAREFCDLERLILRLHIDFLHNPDLSQMRELYCYDLMNRAGAYTSRTGSTRLTITIDGQRHYFGIYTLMEPIDKPFLTKRGTAASTI